MKKLAYLSGAFVFLFSACVTVPAFTQKKETRNVDSFKSVGLAVAGNLHVTQGANFEVILEGPENLLEDINTKVEHNSLKITYNTPWRFSRSKVEIYITMPEIEGLSVAGSGNITNETPLNTDNLSLAIAGSGNININNLMTNDVSAKISGSGNINISGDKTSDRIEIAISGSGNIDCSRLEADQVEARISGSGDASVFANGHLDAAISGSGGIKYKGNPIINAKVSGSGRVRSVN